MPFVNELISEEEKNNFDFTTIDSSFEWSLKPHKWTIDRERNAVLVRIKQDREPPYPHVYGFIWKGLRFEPWVHHSNVKSDSGKWIHTCRIEHAFLPKGVPALSKDVDEMLEALEEALLVEAKARYPNPEDVEEICIENPFNKGEQQ